MDHESELSDSNIINETGIARVKLFLKTYWKTLVIVTTPFILLPVAVTGGNSAYKCFYIFLVTDVYWVADVMHPCAAAMVPIALSTVMISNDLITQFFLRNCLVDCLGVMMLIVAVENSRLHKRMAVKLLMIFGCSHYRLSFLLFFFCMLLSMWVSNVVACGLMMPVVKGILLELEKLGILEVYHNDGKSRKKTVWHEETIPDPTDYTVFYFLGIAYSSTIGSMGTLYGSHANQTFKYIAETMFPIGPSIEFPHFMLLNLPGVLLMETLLYMWMNFYFLGMFRAHSAIALEIGLTQEESQYIHTMLTTEYQLLKKPTFYEWVVGSVVLLNVILHVTTSSISFGHSNISSPSIVSALLLFFIPMKFDFNFFKRLVSGSCALFDSLKTSRMTEEFYTFLLYFKTWPASALCFLIIVFCKVLTEFAPAACLAHSLLPIVGKLGIASEINPHYLMTAAVLGASVPFHFIVGSTSHAMVSRYVYIPQSKMLRTGVGPSLISIVVLWFTCAVWSKAIWSDNDQFPQWARFLSDRDMEKL